METTNKTTEHGVHNSKIHDNAAKIVFGDSTLCAQFLKGYTDIPFFTNIKPEDIEDVSSHFIPLFQESRDSDIVKKIQIENTELYLIALIEHQSDADADMSFRLLRYMVYVWTDYAATQEKLKPGITKSKDFLYPPILPIIYYEGTGQWTSALHFKDRVFMSDIFEEFIPDYKYLVIPLNKYSQEDLIEKGDELSAIFILNKLKSSSDFKHLKEIPEDYWNHLTQNTPPHILKLMSSVFSAFLHTINVPAEEINDLTDHITRRQFNMMFDSFEAYDVQETRRISREEGERAGRIEGEQLYLIKKIIKKIQKHYSVERISDNLDESPATIQPIYDLAMKQAPDFDAEKILAQLIPKTTESLSK